MNEQDFKDRTKQLGIEVARLAQTLPAGRVADPIVRQLVRSATSVGANYRAACRGRSSADVLAKLGVVEEEADETLYWLEVLRELQVTATEPLNVLVVEANEILSMTVASIKTLRSRLSDGYPEIRVVQSKIQNPKSKMR